MLQTLISINLLSTNSPQVLIVIKLVQEQDNVHEEDAMPALGHPLISTIHPISKH